MVYNARSIDYRLKHFFILKSSTKGSIKDSLVYSFNDIAKKSYSKNKYDYKKKFQYLIFLLL